MGSIKFSWILICKQITKSEDQTLSLKTKKKKKKKKEPVIGRIAADNGVKIKESEKIDKYLDLSRELKKLWNINVTVVPIVVGAIPKNIKRRWEIRGWIVTVQINNNF